MYSTVADYSGSSLFPAVPVDRIAIVNNTGSPLLSGTPAKISGEISPGIYWAQPAVDNSKFWGVVESELAPGEAGFMRVQGVMQLMISGGSGRYAIPFDGKLTAGDAGRAEIISRGNDGMFSTILLGGSGTAEGYRKYFKLTALGNNRYAVIDGSRPEREYCGDTMIPGCTQIPRFEFELPEAGKEYGVYLCAVYNETSDSYSTAWVIGTESKARDAGFAHTTIGYIYSDGSVSQTYNDYGWNLREWYL